MLIYLVAFFATYASAAGTGTNCKTDATTAPTSKDGYTTPTTSTDKATTLTLPSKNDYTPPTGSPEPRIKQSQLSYHVPTESEDIVQENVAWLQEYGGSCTCPSGGVYQAAATSFKEGRCGELACKYGRAGACNEFKGEWSHQSVTCAQKRPYNKNAEGFNSISKLFEGYNILLGNPLPFDEPGGDPGFTNQIFAENYNQQQQTADFRFMVPDNVDASSCQSSCALSMTAEVLKSESDYANTLKDDVKWDAAAGAAGSVGGFSFGFSAAFSASSQYQTMSKGYTQEESQYIISSATCCSYKFKHQNGGTLASLDKGFVSDVWNLPEEYDENAYASFVGRYGTHYVQEVAMGSKYAEIDRITTQNMDKLEAIHSDIQHSAEVKACIGLYHASGGGSNQHSTSNQNQNTWENNIASQHIVTLGALPPKDASDGKAWTKAAVNNPQPIEVTLGDISFVLSDVFVSSYVMDPTELQQRKANLEKYMGTYCQRMKSNGALAKYAQCPCDTIDCCHSRDDSNICAMLPFNDFCRKSGVCTGCKDAPAPTSENSKATCGDRVQKYSTSGGMSENDASCRVKSEAPQYCACLQCKKDHNIVEDNAPNTGGWGGSCTCPDGSVYQVGDNDNSCGSLACFGGHSGTCNKWNGAWSHRKVTCQGFTPAATAPPTRNFALIDGGPGSDAELQEVMNPDPTKKLGKVQCCKGRKCTRHNPANSIRRKHCISGYDDKSKVFTLQEAKNACAAIGWSLCTRQEVDAKHCNKHGCGNDSEYVWVLETNGAEDAVARMSPVEESEVAESSGCSKWTLFWADCKVDSDCCPEKSWTCGRDNKCIWHDLSPNAWSKCDIYTKAANWIASKVADEAACTTEAMAAYHRRDV